MRRFRRAQSSTLFRGSEFARLMTMVVMLGVLVLLMMRAKDPRTWTWIAGEGPIQEDEAPAVAAVEPAAPAPKPAPTPPAALPPAGPTDLDPEEKEAAQEEYQAITDKVPLRVEEMPAYWRLLQWQKNQSIGKLRKRARRNLFYSHFWGRPAQYRGQLIRVELHLKRVLSYEEDKPGFKRLYEAWGWSDSQPNSYVVLLSELPKGMPQGLDIAEDVIVYGYFLKLMGYEEAHDGKSRTAPLLIGKAVWRTTSAPQHAASDWIWTWGIGGLLLILFLARWGMTFLPRRKTGNWSRLGPVPGEQPGAVEGWLEGSEHGSPWDEQSLSEPTNGNGKPHEHTWNERVDERGEDER